MFKMGVDMNTTVGVWQVLTKQQRNTKVHIQELKQKYEPLKYRTYIEN